MARMLTDKPTAKSPVSVAAASAATEKKSRQISGLYANSTLDASASLKSDRPR